MFSETKRVMVLNFFYPAALFDFDNDNFVFAPEKTMLFLYNYQSYLLRFGMQFLST
jgi:hypothetical protein